MTITPGKTIMQCRKPDHQRVVVHVACFVLITILFSGSVSAAEPALIDQHVKVYFQPGRYGGWPANYGIWSWGDEILVGFELGYHKDLGPGRHAIDRDRP